MKARFAPVALLCLLTGALLAIPGSASAQGRGQANGQGQGRPKGPQGPTTTTPTTSTSGSSGSTSGSSSSSGSSGSSSTSTSTPATTSVPTQGSTPSDLTLATPDFVAPATTFRQFGSWLDDASTMSKSEGYVSISAGHWRLAEVTQTNVPMVAVGMGISDRVQVGASVPFYRVNYQGTTSSGLDDVYLSGKINLLDPTLTINEVGLSVSPVMEILSAGDDRVHFAIPVNLEVRRFPFRVFASGGYFTRGSMFAGGAVEWWSSTTGVTLTGALTQSYSLKEDLTLDTLGVSRQHVDVMGTVSRPLNQFAAASVSVGRSLSSVEQGGTKLAISGGVTLRFSSIRTAP